MENSVFMINKLDPNSNAYTDTLKNINPAVTTDSIETVSDHKTALQNLINLTTGTFSSAVLRRDVTLNLT